MSKSYRLSPIFDEISLPEALRRNHSTRAGVWGVIRVLEGDLRLNIVDPPSDCILSPGAPGLVQPQQLHFVTPLGAVRMQVEFHDAPPVLSIKS